MPVMARVSTKAVLAILLLAASGLLMADSSAPTAEQQQREHLLQQLVLEQERQSTSGQMRVLEQLGDHYFTYSQYLLALDHFLLARDLATQIEASAPGDSAAVADRIRADKNVGITYRLLGEFELAMQTLESAETDSRSIDDTPLRLSILGNLGSVYKRLGAYSLASETYHDALRLAEAAGADTEYRDILIRIGELYLDAGSDDDALDVLDLAHEMLMTLDNVDPLELAWTRTVLGSAHLETGDVAQARTHFESAATQYREAGLDDPYHYRVLDLALSTSDSDRATSAAWYREVIENSGSPAIVWQAHVGLAGQAAEEQRTETAIELYTEAMVHFRRALRMDLSQAELQSMRRQFRAIADPLVELLVRRDQAGDLLQALHLTEYARVPDIQLPDQNNLRQQRAIVEIQRQLSRTDLESDRRREYRQQLERAELDLAEVVREAAPEDTLPEFTLAEIRQSLHHDEALLQYHCGKQYLTVFLFRDDHQITRQMAMDCEDLARRAGNLKNLLETDQTHLYRYPAQYLYRQLISPIMSELNAVSHLMVITPDFMQQLPFSVLMNGDDFLVQYHSIERLGSVRQLLELDTSAQRMHSAVSRPVLFMGMPKAGNGSGDSGMAAIFSEQGMPLSDLPAVRDEGRVVNRYAPAHSMLMSGSNATETRYKSVASKQWSIMHFATHGLMSARRAERSAVLLSHSVDGIEDGFLQAREVVQQQLDTALVVLSGCRTASIPERQDLGRLGFAGGLSCRRCRCGSWDAVEYQ